jgi:UDP-galactopyranose mutase
MPAWRVIGAGFAGAVAARQLAEGGVGEVVVQERREHIGGNAFDELDAHGIRVHRYGPHIFHTNSPRVWDYLSRFTAWRPYEHRVRACVEGRLLPLPINRTTINELYGLRLDEAGVRAFLERVRERREPVRSSEDVVLNAVGRDLFEKFFRGYTRKQWGREAAELAPSVAARIPVRTNDEDRYFTDRFQAMPAEGYTRLFERMLDHPAIRLELGTAFSPGAAPAGERRVYTGPLDAYFGYRLGCLPYRSLRFEHLHLADREWFQATGTVNYPGAQPFTRITEFKHLTGQMAPGTSIVREYPQADGEPYYPVPCAESEALRAQYLALAQAERDVIFVGRLAQYRYYNMDQAVAAALVATDTALGRERA